MDESAEHLKTLATQQKAHSRTSYCPRHVKRDIYVFHGGASVPSDSPNKLAWAPPRLIYLHGSGTRYDICQICCQIWCMPCLVSDLVPSQSTLEASRPTYWGYLVWALAPHGKSEHMFRKGWDSTGGLRQDPQPWPHFARAFQLLFDTLHDKQFV
jgi:hypothetical protein